MLSIYQFIDFNLIHYFYLIVLIINHLITLHINKIEEEKLDTTYSLLQANVKNSSSNFTRKSNKNEIYLFVEN